MPKNGTSKGRQVYRCGDCGRYYTHGAAYTRPSAADREQALALLGEGVSQSAAARIVGVTPPAVSRWVKKGGCRTLPAALPGAAAHADPAGGDCLCCNVDLSAGATRGAATGLVDLDGGSWENRRPPLGGYRNTPVQALRWATAAKILFNGCMPACRLRYRSKRLRRWIPAFDGMAVVGVGMAVAGASRNDGCRGIGRNDENQAAYKGTLLLDAA